MRMVRVREKVFRNSGGIRFNVSFVDCTSVFVKSVLETSNITQHFHAFLISYANILTSYTPLTVAKRSLSNRLLLLTDVALSFY